MKVIVVGYGFMGKKVASRVRESEDMELLGVVSPYFDEPAPENNYSSISECNVKADVIIDFSHPNNLESVLEYGLKNKSKLVLATTGYSSEQLILIEEASKSIAIFQSYNTSLGIQMVTKILRTVSKELYESGFDIEIIEKHHNQKIDAPSGTAKLIYDVIEEEVENTTPIYDRSQSREKRKREEVGIQAIRGGTIFGEHTVIFAGKDEVIEVTHNALSKEVFVQGAISAAKSLIDKEVGLYTLKTLY